MGSNLHLQLSELLSNPSPRTPIVLCLDTSGSMRGDKLQSLNRGIASFYQALRSDETAVSSAMVSIVTFDNVVTLIQPFQTLDTYTSTPQIPSVNGYTALGQGVDLALNQLAAQKELFKKTGVDYHQPWIVIMTDGCPENEAATVTAAAARRCQEMERSGKLVVLPIGIGDNADMRTLQTFTTHEALRLDGLRFNEFFRWLSSSVVRVSQSRVTDNFRPDIKGMSTWRKI